MRATIAAFSPPLGDAVEHEAQRELAGGPHDRHGCWRVGHRQHEVLVHRQLVGRQLGQHREQEVADAEFINRDPHAARIQRAQQLDGRARSEAAAVSVTSTDRALAGRSRHASSSRIQLASSGLVSERADRMTDTGCCRPRPRQRSWASSVSATTHSVSRSMRPVRLASTMKRSGGTRPRPAAPAQQGLERCRLAASHGDLGLVREAQLVALGGRGARRRAARGPRP